MLADASTFVKSVDDTFLFITIASLLLLLLVTFLMVFFVFKYNRKKNKKAVNIHGNIGLEIAWTILPTILVLFMFWFGWEGYKQMTNVPKNAMTVDVTAMMWQWKFKYANGVTTDTLYVPVKENIKLNLSSVDVNHAFFVPAFRIKKDVIPNRQNIVWFNADEVGSYDIACAEYCGLRHSYMYSKVVVMPQDKYDEHMNKLSAVNKAQADSTNVKPAGDSLKLKPASNTK